MKKLVLACDFCGKTQHEAGHLVASDKELRSAVVICGECVDLAREVIEEAHAKKMARLPLAENVANTAGEPLLEGPVKVVHQAQVENGRWIDIDPQEISGYRSCFATVRTLYAAPPMASVAPAVRTWRERIGAGPDFPRNGAADVERAMEAEIADLCATLASMQGGDNG